MALMAMTVEGNVAAGRGNTIESPQYTVVHAKWTLSDEIRLYRASTWISTPMEDSKATQIGLHNAGLPRAAMGGVVSYAAAALEPAYGKEEMQKDVDFVDWINLPCLVKYEEIQRENIRDYVQEIEIRMKLLECPINKDGMGHEKFGRKEAKMALGSH